MFTRNLLLVLLLMFSFYSYAQVCSNLGQNPGTAFPVCGSSSFNQSTVAVCGQKTVPTPCLANGSIFQDKNPYWYKFTCFTTGTLGFLITPKNLKDDYDWQLFDVTNHDPVEVYNNSTLFVACNWSGETGKTGASAAGKSLQNCEGTGVPLFSEMPTLTKGHNYLLLVSHFDDNSQSGYSLDFGGGTAVITDTTKPAMQQSKASCDGKRISIKFNKKLKCRTLAINGSDFALSATSASVVAALGTDCSGSFDMDSVVLTLSDRLLPGTYTVKMQKGTDNNTLLDNCDVPVTEGDSLSFVVYPAEPAALDSVATPGCAPDELQLFLNSVVLCSSIAADGSDFSISGSTGTVITNATGVCNNNLTTVIKLKLSKPIYTSGTHQVTLKPGSDGNTLLNECALETPGGSTLVFTTKDTVSAAFNYLIKYGCKGDSVLFSNSGDIGINKWKWQFSSTDTSTEQNPVHVYKTYGDQQVKLTVWNEKCTDSAATTFTLDNELKADFAAPNVLCPNDVASFKDTSIGKILLWNWNFGNGSTSIAKNPPAQVYPLVSSDQNVRVRLIVQNNYDCFDTAYKQVKILYNCYIAVATAFTPNGDNRNDYLYPINAWKAKNLVFKVFNRFGQLVFETTDFTNKWDGSIKGIKQATGTYVWTLQYTHVDTGKSYFLKGTTVLIR